MRGELEDNNEISYDIRTDLQGLSKKILETAIYNPAHADITLEAST